MQRPTCSLSPLTFHLTRTSSLSLSPRLFFQQPRRCLRGRPTCLLARVRSRGNSSLTLRELVRRRVAVAWPGGSSLHANAGSLLLAACAVAVAARRSSRSRYFNLRHRGRAGGQGADVRETARPGSEWDGLLYTRRPGGAAGARPWTPAWTARPGRCGRSLLEHATAGTTTSATTAPGAPQAAPEPDLVAPRARPHYCRCSSPAGASDAMAGAPLPRAVMGPCPLGRAPASTCELLLPPARPASPLAAPPARLAASSAPATSLAKGMDSALLSATARRQTGEQQEGREGERARHAEGVRWPDRQWVHA
ncbi:uncharacterized protein, partial [Triticum aestivum]|uniref:uncharacterized protein n=1 Tax=Triticum aestivum TaxID=4565 RepID=UPI001D01AD2F